MKIFCSYCRKEIGEKEPFEDDRISHGVCKECQDNNPKQIRGVVFPTGGASMSIWSSLTPLYS